MTGNRWLQLIEEDPNHSQWYIERFRTMASEGADLVGEARMIDAMVPPGSRILDAGCGPGRTGGYLARAGHQVVGVDLDPELIVAANEDHPGATWIVGDLAELDLSASPIAEFDVIVSAGNVMTFVDPATRVAVLRNLGDHLTGEGRLVIGFGQGRGHTYDYDDYFADVASAGLTVDLRLATWDLRPFTAESEFLVSVLRR